MGRTDILSLPNEILIEILKNFDYYTLNFEIILTCRRFYDIIAHTTHGDLGEILMKSKIHSRASKKSRVEGYVAVHPCIPKLVMDTVLLKRRPLSLDEIGFGTPRTEKFLPLSATRLANENALTIPLAVYTGALRFSLGELGVERLREDFHEVITSERNINPHADIRKVLTVAEFVIYMADYLGEEGKIWYSHTSPEPMYFFSRNLLSHNLPITQMGCYRLRPWFDPLAMRRRSISFLSHVYPLEEVFVVKEGWRKRHFWLLRGVNPEGMCLSEEKGNLHRVFMIDRD